MEEGKTHHIRKEESTGCWKRKLDTGLKQKEINFQKNAKNMMLKEETGDRNETEREREIFRKIIITIDAGKTEE